MSALSVLVTVGSDHHPFDRLIDWVDEWLGAPRDESVSCVVQHGTAVAPRHGTAYAYLPHATLQELVRGADVVVTQGGPMGIVESRRLGTKPIAVPRLARLGEVVDDHQVAFCRQLAASDDLVLAEHPAALWAALDHALTDAAAYAIEASAEDVRVGRTVERFAEMVADLPPRRSLLGRRSSRS